MAVARLKGDPRIGITGMRKRIFPDGDTMKEKVHKLVSASSFTKMWISIQ